MAARERGGAEICRFDPGFGDDVTVRAAQPDRLRRRRDVEMAACMPTSRIVPAHATVQLFVLRCLMGLEPTSVASVGHDTGWKQWDWMADFRSGRPTGRSSCAGS